MYMQHWSKNSTDNHKADHMQAVVRSGQVINQCLKDDGSFPNNERLSLLIYQGALALPQSNPAAIVESFIDNIQDKNKLVVLTTGRLDSWKPDSPEVDAITSASTMSETGVVASTIADKVMVIINSQKNI